MIYVTNTPCVVCAKMLINAGVVEIVYDGDYPDDLAREILAESDMKLRQFHLEKKIDFLENHF